MEEIPSSSPVPDRGEAGLEIEQSAAGERAADRPPLDALTAPRPSEQGVQLLGPGALRQLRDRPAQRLRLREPEDPLRGRVPAMRPSGWVERIASRAWRRMLVRRGSTLDRRRRFELRERFVRGPHGHELETRGRRHRAQASRLLRILGARDEERDVGTHGDARGEAGKT